MVSHTSVSLVSVMKLMLNIPYKHTLTSKWYEIWVLHLQTFTIISSICHCTTDKKYYIKPIYIYIYRHTHTIFSITAMLLFYFPPPPPPKKKHTHTHTQKLYIFWTSITIYYFTITYKEAGLSVVFPHKLAHLQSCCDYMKQKRTNVCMVSTGTSSTPKLTKIGQ